MKIKVYFLGCLVYFIISIILIIGFHNNDLFSGNEGKQMKTISSIFYIIYSLKVFIMLVPILFYQANRTDFKNKLILVIPLIFVIAMLIRISLTEYNGEINMHLRSLEILLELSFAVLWGVIFMYFIEYIFKQKVV